MEKTIEALEKLIAVKDETIKELERQIQLLKNQTPLVVPQEIPQVPLNPWTQPWSPTQPVNPQWPWGGPYYGPYIVTYSTSSADLNTQQSNVFSIKA